MTTPLPPNLIARALPHRYPFLLIDRVVSAEPGVGIVAIKNVSVNEPQFTGHFPRHAVMPGVLMVEALAQACGILMYLSANDEERANLKDDYIVLAGIDSCRFRRVVTPGDTLVLHANIKQRKARLVKFLARAEVEGKTACEAELTSARASV